MQNKFVADVGDFAKYGLLRWLCGDGGDRRPLRLGVIWYWNPDSEPQVIHLERPHACQKAYYYICNPSADELLLQGCDPELLDILRDIVIGRARSVADIEQSGALQGDTVYFRGQVPILGRENWFESTLYTVRDSELAFLDPDNGLADEPDIEHATHLEAAKLWGKGKSLVIYQHFSRAGDADEQIARHAFQLRAALGVDGPPGEIVALRFRRRIARVFFVIPNPANKEVFRLLSERVDSFAKSRWVEGRHFTHVDV